MESNNSIDKNELPTNRPIYWNRGKINLPDDFVKKFGDYFSDGKLSKLLASFPSVKSPYEYAVLEAQCSCSENEICKILNGNKGETDFGIADRNLRLAQYGLDCFVYCNSYRELFLKYKKSVEKLIREGANEKNLEEIAKLKKEIDEYEELGKIKLLIDDKVKNLDFKYYKVFSGNYQYLVKNDNDYSGFDEIKGDATDFCTKIYSYILIYKEIKDAYLYIEYLIIMLSICQLLENFSFENNVKGLLTE